MKFLADHNLNDAIVTGLLREKPSLDVSRARNVGLAEAIDPEVLAWAADEGRIVLTHDKKTMPDFAGDRLRAGKPMTGLIVIKTTASHRAVIDDLLLIVECTTSEDWHGKIERLPLWPL